MKDENPVLPPYRKADVIPSIHLPHPSPSPIPPIAHAHGPKSAQTAAAALLLPPPEVPRADHAAAAPAPRAAGHGHIAPEAAGRQGAQVADEGEAGRVLPGRWDGSDGGAEGGRGRGRLGGWSSLVSKLDTN